MSSPGVKSSNTSVLRLIQHPALALLCCLAFSQANVIAQLGGNEVPTEVAVKKSGQLHFNFSGAGWRDVLTWIADQADLALQLDTIPAGTFTYSDPTRGYNVSEGMDVVNLALMKRGYTLVRRGRVLELIDLEVENAEELISEIAELVRPEDLDSRGRSDILSCVFPLGSMTPDQAREELSLMKGPWGRVVVLESARQVKVTETASKLIAIRDTLANASEVSTSVIEIALQNRGADELLELARPLLGLEPGANSGEDIRISIGLYGDKIYATGMPSKTGLLKSTDRKGRQATRDTRIHFRGDRSGLQDSCRNQRGCHSGVRRAANHA